MNSQRRIMVTGAAGFIGFHFSKLLLDRGFEVIGIDNLNDYYSVELKRARLAKLEAHPSANFFHFHSLDLNDPSFRSIFESCLPEVVVHLAAQAGVRYSIENPGTYLKNNADAFVRLLEIVKDHQIKHFIYASSSSVYGKNTKLPFSTKDTVDHPVSFYAATKKFNELTAHVYSHLYRTPTTGLRFFTVYGSWGRPDMAYFGFSEKMRKKETISLFNHGEMKRDFTHVSDIVESMIRLIDLPPQVNSNDEVPYAIFNIGASEPVALKEFISTLEDSLGIKAKTELLPMQPGDVVSTYADVADLERITGYKPHVSLREGLKEFADWYKKYYRINEKSEK